MALGILRQHRRWLYGFLWVIVAAFILAYIPAFTGSEAGSPGETLARVGSSAITVGEFQKAQVQKRQFYERLYQGRLDAAALRSLGLEEQTLDDLVQTRLVEQEARRLGITVSDQEVARYLATSPQFQRDGVFVGAGEIRRLLELQGVSEEQFEQELRRAMLRERLESLVTAGVMVSPDEVEKEYRRRNEQVKLAYVIADAARFQPGLEATDAEIEARFNAHKDAYRVPEERTIEYLLLSPEALRSKVALNDAEIKGHYDAGPEAYREEAKACASHILVKVKGENQAEGHGEEEAKALAQKLLDEVKKGADFAEVAKRASEDKGSAPGGGDLGCFERGRMVPPFEAAAFALQPGQTSDLVKTNFGYHVIRLSRLQPETTQPFEQVKEQIRQQLTQDRLRAMLDEKVDAVSSALGEGKSLEEAGKLQSLTVQKAPPLQKGGGSPLFPPPVQAKLFELKAGETSPDPVRMGGGGYAFVRVTEVKPSRDAELKDVKEKVRADVLEEKARAKARELAEQVRAAAEKDGLDKAAAAAGLTRKEMPGPAPRTQPLGELGTGAALEEAAFSLEPQALSAAVPVSAGYAVLQVQEKKGVDPAAFEREKASVLNSLREERKRTLFDAYLREARQRFPVERNPEAFRRLAARS